MARSALLRRGYAGQAAARGREATGNPEPAAGNQQARGDGELWWLKGMVHKMFFQKNLCVLCDLCGRTAD